MSYLLVIAGDDKGRVVELPVAGQVVLGRGIADVNFADGRLSRKHCLIEVSPDACVLRDLESTNGVFVNGVKIAETELRDGDKVRLGYTVVEFRAGDAVEVEEEEAGRPAAEQAVEVKRRIQAAKSAAMGKDPISDTRRLFSAKGRFCEGCGCDIEPAELEEGKAKRIDGFFMCPDCVLIVEEKDIEPKNVASYLRWKAQGKRADDAGDTGRGLEPIE